MKPTKERTRAQRALDWMFTCPGQGITLIGLLVVWWFFPR
jgi:hypothetical protein